MTGGKLLIKVLLYIQNTVDETVSIETDGLLDKIENMHRIL